MSEAYLTIKELDFIKHSLGLDNGKRAYRNYYAGESEIGNDLVAKDFAKRVEASEHNKYPIYHITEKGIEILRKYIGNFKIID